MTSDPTTDRHREARETAAAFVNALLTSPFAPDDDIPVPRKYLAALAALPDSGERAGLREAIETLDAAGFTVHGIHAPAESWMLCQDQRCLRIRAALTTLETLLGYSATPTRDAQPADILGQTAWPGFERHQHADGSWCQRKIEEPSPAGPEEPREGLREALIPLATHYADHKFHPEDHQPDDECWTNLYRAIVGLDTPDALATPAPDTGAEHVQSPTNPSWCECGLPWPCSKRDPMLGWRIAKCPHCGEELTVHNPPAPDSGAEERLRAALEVGRVRALLEDLYDRSTPMHSPTCAMQDDEAECICGTGAVLERVSDELRAGRALSGGSVDEERDSDES